MKRILLFAAGCAVLGALVWYAGPGAVGHALVILGISGLVFVALLHAPLLVLMGLAWRVASGGAAPPMAFISARFIRDAAAEVLPFSQVGGFAVAVRALGLRGVTTLAAALSLFVDLVAEFAAKLPYTVAGLVVLALLRPDLKWLVPVLAVVAFLAAGIVLALRSGAALLRRLEMVAQSVLQRWMTRPPAIGEIAGAFGRKRVAPSFALHVLCWFLGAGETWVIFAMMQHPVTLAQALVLDSLANALRTFAFFIPAAAGVQEGAYVAIGALIGVPPPVALAFSLARRAREFVLGVPGLLLWQVWEVAPARRS